MADRFGGPIDFAGLNGLLLDRAEQLVPQWLPGGKRRGHEWVCGSLAGDEGDSLSVNLVTGMWADFASDERGGDLTSLYAAIHNLGQGAAARQLMQDLGWQASTPMQAPARHASGGDRPAQPTQAGEPPPWDGPPEESDSPPVEGRSMGAAVRRKSVWRAIVPVPPSARPCDFWHWQYKPADLVRTWEYRFEGQLYGHVARFRNSSGGKEIIPYTWCVDESDSRGSMKWHNKQWDEPRPLYVPATLLSGNPSEIPVVLVEGEKCAEAGHALLPAEFDFVSWPGGGNAWAKAAWGWLMGRTVYLWPDADSKRVKLTPSERDANVDPDSKPLLEAHRQPGMKAMVAIGTHLVAEHGCTVFICPIPKPGAISDGWDLADAIESGWGPDEVRAFIRGAVPFTPPSDEARAKASAARSTPTEAGAAPEVNAWRGALLCTEKGAIKAARENVVLALDGMELPDGRGRLAGIAEADGVIGFNTFTNNVEKLKPAPWGSPAGVWQEEDELWLGEWLVREHYLPSMPRGTLEEAVLMVAKRHCFHPVRDWLQSLDGKHDGQPRLKTWLRRCCLEEDEWDDADPLQQYLARVGTWLIMAMCQRVLQPGCKFDYMVIFEGAQGVGKSTLARVLGGDYYADTGLVLGDKDSYQNLQGIWAYEMGELDALNKSDITKIKLYISSMKDRFRASFDKRPKDYPRQVVFLGTTNEDHYLSDPTGNRRMWPVKVTRQIDIEWLIVNRVQLFAEAMVMLQAGNRFHPTPKEQRQLFEPQQQQRVVENAIESAIARYLYDDMNGQVLDEFTLVALLGKIGIGVEKLGPGRFHEKQAAAALRRLGWREKKSSLPGRPRVYCRPPASHGVAASGSPDSFDHPAQGQHHGDPNGIPF